MCGIVGFLGIVGGDYAAHARAMADRLSHRGPDDSGVWVDAEARLALGHRRLAILDLSSAGHQPMETASGRFVLSYNGEIYNHQALRRELQREGHAIAWRSASSDTETLLVCFATWGVRRTLEAAVGMFAISLWDKQERVLTLARDRLGEKPLYYGWLGDTLLFGSELSAFQVHPSFAAEIDRDALTLFLRHNYIPAPHTIYRGVHKLLPGHFLTMTLGEGPARAKAATPVAYWTVNAAVESGLAKPLRVSIDEAAEALEARLVEAVRLQMLAEVPLGAFLSGGVDSSTIVALMQAHHPRPVRTFTIGFGEAEFNEAAHAKRVAEHLGTDHTEMFLSASDALDVVPRLSSIFSEPFGDSSQIPTHLVSALTRRHVTVALSGDAGDELFGGYTRYALARSIWNRLRPLPPPLRRALAVAIRTLPRAGWDAVLGAVRPALPSTFRVVRPGDQAHKLADVIGAANEKALYHELVSLWHHPSEVVFGGSEPLTAFNDPAAWPRTDSFEHWMMAIDTMTYLPDDILTKVDRAAMATSLETRVPFLDHRVVELAWRLPLSVKLRGGEGKLVLRRILDRYVPRHLIERPKMGFAVPIDSWLRGPLRAWGEELLGDRLKREGCFSPAPIRRAWADHQSGRANLHHRLWPVLMFQSWMENRA